MDYDTTTNTTTYTPTYTTTKVDSGGSALFGGTLMLFYLAVLVVAVIGMWKVFTKAKQPGWAVLIPFYGTYVLLKIIGRPGWWLLLYFIPFVNIIVSIINAVDLAKSFGKSETFGVVGLWLFNIVGYLMLGYGPDKYVGPSAKSAK